MPSEVNSKYLLFSLAFFFLFAMQYTQDNLGGHGLSLPVNSMSWIAVSFIIAVGAWQWCKAKELIITFIDKMALFLFICLLLPMIWSDSPWREGVLDRYVAILAFWFVVISVRQFPLNSEQLKTALLLIVLGVLLQCFYGLFQFLTNNFDLIKNFRPSGSTQQVNVLASMTATGFGVSFYQLLLGGLNRPVKYLHYLMVIIAGVIEIIIFSRTGMLGIIIVFVCLSILFLKHWKKIINILLIFAVGVGIGYSLKNLNQVDYREGIYNAGLRSTFYSVALELIKDKPIMGHGMGKFSSVYIDKQAEYYEIYERVPTRTVSLAFPHNEFLYWWIEGGILPVLAIIIFAVFFSIQVWRNGTVNNKASWLCTIPIILHTQTEYPLYHSVPTLIILAFLISLSVNTKTFKFNPPYSLIPKALVYVLPPITIIFMLTNLHTTWLMNKFWVKGDYQYLFQTVNPFTQKASLGFYRSNGLLISGEPNSLVLAEKLLKEEILKRPTHLAYWSLYNVQIKSNQLDEAQKTYDLAKYLYPASAKFN